MADLKEQANFLRREGIEALLNYEVWWVIRSPDTEKIHGDTLTSYSAYFEVAKNAHFVAMVLPLYRIFETRKDSINLPQLIKKLRSINALEEGVLKNFEKQINTLKLTWNKIATIRKEVFGHRSSKYDISESFERAKISPDEIERFISDTLELLNKVDRSLNDEYTVYQTGAGEELANILNVLKTSL